MKIKKSEIVSKETRERGDALQIAQKTAASLNELQGKFEASEISLKEYFDQTSNTIQQALQSFSEAVLLQPEIDVNLEPLNELLKETFEKFGKSIIDIQSAVEKIEVPQPNIEFKPDIKVKAPEVDLTGLENLLRTELPKIFAELIKAIPKQKPLNLQPLDEKFDKIIGLLTSIKDKKMPMFVGGGGGGGGNGTPYQDSSGTFQYVQLQGGSIPVVNPDGSNIGGGGLTNTELRAAPIQTTSPIYKLLLDDTSTTNVTYVGKAAIGSATSASVWQIQKIDETTGMSITWAGTALFTAKWDDRTTETYA